MKITKLTVVDVQVSALMYASRASSTYIEEHSFTQAFIDATRGFAVPHCGGLPSSLVAQPASIEPE